jgi:hypothetical protein
MSSPHQHAYAVLMAARQRASAAQYDASVRMAGIPRQGAAVPFMLSMVQPQPAFHAPMPDGMRSMPPVPPASSAVHDASSGLGMRGGRGRGGSARGRGRGRNGPPSGAPRNAGAPSDVAVGDARSLSTQANNVRMPPGLLELIPPKYRFAATVGNSPEEIARWKEARKKHYPSEAAVHTKV